MQSCGAALEFTDTLMRDSAELHLQFLITTVVFSRGAYLSASHVEDETQTQNSHCFMFGQHEALFVSQEVLLT